MNDDSRAAAASRAAVNTASDQHCHARPDHIRPDRGDASVMAAKGGPSVVAMDAMMPAIELLAPLATGHWMWFMFPQLKGLGKSQFSEF